MNSAFSLKVHENPTRGKSELPQHCSRFLRERRMQQGMQHCRKDTCHHDLRKDRQCSSISHELHSYRTRFLFPPVMYYLLWMSKNKESQH